MYSEVLFSKVALYTDIDSLCGFIVLMLQSEVLKIQFCSPGVLLSEEEVNRLSLICEKAGVWLVLDNTYEYFVFDGRRHFCPSGRHVLHIFSFSKVSSIQRSMTNKDLCESVESMLRALQLYVVRSCQKISDGGFLSDPGI